VKGTSEIVRLTWIYNKIWLVKVSLLLIVKHLHHSAIVDFQPLSTWGWDPYFVWCIWAEDSYKFLLKGLFVQLVLMRFMVAISLWCFIVIV
jgi:hypothetical protein